MVEILGSDGCGVFQLGHWLAKGDLVVIVGVGLAALEDVCVVGL